MKLQHLLFGVIGLALLGGGIYLGTTMGKNNGTDPAAATASANGANAAASLGNGNGNGPAAGSNTSSTPRSGDNAWAALKEKYGDGRTKLSKKVSEDMAGLLKDAVELADMGAKLGGAESAKELATRQATDSLTNQLGLSDEQKEKVSALVASRISERMDAVNELASAIEAEPTGMMETILAGDALSRGEMTQEEYDAVSADTLAVMRNVSGFALSGRGGNDLSDPVLAEQLNSVLNAEQQTTLAGIVQKATERAQNSNQQMPFQNGNLPVMELEKLDQTMLSAQKLTTGLRAMMEGFQGMKELNPQPEK
jgi:hypothetical protein